MFKEIAAGSAGNLTRLGDYEHQFSEGDRGKLVLVLRSSIGTSTITGIAGSLKSAGIYNGEIVTKGNTVEIPFQKRVAPLAILAAILVGAIVVWFLVTAWSLLKDLGVDPATVIPIALFIGLLLVGYFVIKSRPSITVGGV